MSFLVPIVVGLVPSLIWVLFFLREDAGHPEPKRLIAYAFFAGAGITFFVIGPQLALTDFFVGTGFGQYGFFTLLILGGIEELFKFLAIYLTISRLKDFDEPIDAMVYMIVAALGFAAVENIASIAHGAPPIGQPGPAEVIALRFVGATLLHSLSSALVGYYWGMAMLKRQPIGAWIAEGIGAATILHGVFNYFIVIYGPSSTLALLLLVITSFFIFNDFEQLRGVSPKPLYGRK